MGVQNTRGDGQRSGAQSLYGIRRQCAVDPLGQLRGKAGFHPQNTIFSGHASPQLSAAVRSGCTDPVCVHVCLLRFRASGGVSWLCAARGSRARSQRQKDPAFSQRLARTLPYPSILLPLFGSAKKGSPRGQSVYPLISMPTSLASQSSGGSPCWEGGHGETDAQAPRGFLLPQVGATSRESRPPTSRPGALTVLQDGLPLRAIDLLAANEVAGGVGEVDEASLSVEVQGPGVHEVLDGDHVLVGDLGPHVHAPDDARPALAIHKEQLVFWLWGGHRRGAQSDARVHTCTRPPPGRCSACSGWVGAARDLNPTDTHTGPERPSEQRPGGWFPVDSRVGNGAKVASSLFSVSVHCSVVKSVAQRAWNLIPFDHCPCCHPSLSSITSCLCRK